MLTPRICLVCDLPDADWRTGYAMKEYVPEGGVIWSCPDCVDWRTVGQTVRVSPEMFDAVEWVFVQGADTPVKETP